MERKNFTPCPLLDRDTGLCTYKGGRLKLIISSSVSFFDRKSWMGVPMVAEIRKFKSTNPNNTYPKVTRLIFCGGNKMLYKQRYCNGNPNKDRELPNEESF